MNKNIKDYLPEKKQYHYLGCRIEKDLADRVNEIREREGLSWADLVIACLEKFVDEMKKGKK